VYQHSGIDILVSPCRNPCAAGDTTCENPCSKPCGGDPTADSGKPCVFVTVKGQANDCDYENPTSTWNSTRIIASDPSWQRPRTYRYVHLKYGTFDAAYYDKCLNSDPSEKIVNSGVPIAEVIEYTCPYHHLHYDIYETMPGNTSEFLNPLSDFAPGVAPDVEAPRIDDIRLAAAPPASRWGEFSPTEGACTVVRGRVDIVADLLDLDTAGSTEAGASNVGVYKLRWKACAASDPTCNNWKSPQEFARMPAEWNQGGNNNTSQQFSTTLPFVSDFDECSSTVNKTFMVASSSPSASWDTTAGTPNGSYTVSVEASDFAGNASTKTAHVCVQNGAGCTIDLAIRDGESDAGATPSADSPFGLSPDITVNSDTADENLRVTTGTTNTIVVQVWNRGSCTLPIGATYNVCLAWSASAEPVSQPIPENQTVGCQAQTVSGVGWTPGVGRSTTFQWTPVVGSVPLGDNSLVAWSDVSGDSPQFSSSVILDNNRAQRNIAFTTTAQPMPPTDVHAQ
jgi:hypothetical protein